MQPKWSVLWNVEPMVPAPVAIVTSFWTWLVWNISIVIAMDLVFMLCDELVGQKAK